MEETPVAVTEAMEVGVGALKLGRRLSEGHG